MTSPLQCYQNDLADGLIKPDPAQALAVAELQKLYSQLVAQSEKPVGLPAVFGGLFKHVFRQSPVPPALKGLYIYGGVGRGKTYLMDTFYECLPFEQKQRTHFHRFMQQVHAGLAGLRQQKNPLEAIAASIASKARVLCFDEFFVSDIGDAMILGGLLEYLMADGVVLVATSNIHPDGLYANGLQRDRFLPAIRLLHQHTTIFELDGGVDYRLRALKQACLYFHPLGIEADAALHDGFNRLASGHAEKLQDTHIQILGRQVPVRRVAEGVAWFDFDQICAGARSAFDYIELAKEYHSIVLANVPRLDATMDDVARRFVSLVDELYDRHVKLIISAAVPLTELYTGHGLSFVFERTRSRLLEMQSEDYLALEHRP
ncbi:MAG: cell division protein ZapE [Pseudohongiella sp.]|nr:cell division protein ZapE [Pseudohongiella sp.]MDO9520857.1 cell division protein ZapE [Pseudohongiella sp.]MDP2128080.1 cell division protein ZapE [Pseudohongiella sp.]